MALSVPRFVTALIVAVVAGVLCIAVQSAPLIERNERPVIEMNNFTEGDCSQEDTVVLMKDFIFRAPMACCHVSTVVDYNGKGQSKECTVTCIRAENFQPGTTGGNLSVTAGGLRQPTIQLTFVSELQKGYYYLVELRGKC